MKSKFTSGILAIGLTAGMLSAPVFPQEMELLFSYQYPADTIYEEVPTATGTIQREIKTKDFKDNNEDGLISVSVFGNKKGELVYTQIDDDKYREMGKRGGFLKNPKKNELISALQFLTPKAEAAIAFNASSSASVSGTSLTYSHTTAGSDRLLTVGFNVYGGNTDRVSGVTYDGVAMTREQQQSEPNNGAIAFLYYLLAPSTGANNVVISLTESELIQAHSSSYTGIAQVAPEDSNSAAAFSTSISTSLTPTTDDSWIVGLFANVNGNAFTAGTGVVLSESNSYVTGYRGPINPAGLTSFSATVANSRNIVVAASFAPAAEAEAATDLGTIILFQ